MPHELLDIENFEEFYRQHFAPVVRYCTSIVKDQEEASDIVQQAFVSLWQKRKEVQIHSSLKSYLYKTVYNFSINQGKQNAARVLREKRAEYLKSEGDDSDEISKRELQQIIDNAIHKLPEQCRKVFQMSRNENLKYRQIAHELKLSEKTVENLMGKALRLLRIALAEYLPLFLLLMLLYHE